MTEQDQPTTGGDSCGDGGGAVDPPLSAYEQYQPPEPSATYPPVEEEPDPDFSYGPSMSSYPPAQTHLLVGASTGAGGSRTTTRTAGLLGGVVLLVVAVATVGIFGVVREAEDTFDSIRDDPGSGELLDDPAPPDVFTASGYADILAAVRRETGSTQAFDVLLYPEYAVLTVPVDGTGDRALSYLWDGDLRPAIKRTSDDTRFDLEAIDPDGVRTLVRRARRQLVEDPTTSYVRIRSPRDSDEGAWLKAYASNEFSESGYLAATLDGTIVNRYQSTSE